MAQLLSGPLGRCPLHWASSQRYPGVPWREWPLAQNPQWPHQALGVGKRIDPPVWLMRLLQKDPAGSGKRMDCSQGLVNNKTDSNDADMRFYFILFQSQNAFMLFRPNVVLMLLVFAKLRTRPFACSKWAATDGKQICTLFFIGKKLEPNSLCLWQGSFAQ